MKQLLKFSLAIILIGALSYAFHEISLLSQRLEKIEERLGGSEKVGCNEKDTVEMVRQSVVRIVGGESEGSGFAIQNGGIILTNFHVIESEPNPKVIFPDNTFETAQVIMADKDADLAVIKVNTDVPALRLAPPHGLSAAEQVFAIGYPLGGELPGESSIIRGSFSRLAKDKKNGIEYLQANMTLIGGISGGPMVNICGEVVGVNTSGLLLGGMGIAISADSVKEKWRKMVESKDPLKDVRKIDFKPNESPLEAVKAFYNYLKARKLEKGFELLSDHFVRGYSFEQWAFGYKPNLDTSIVWIKSDKKIANRINIKLATKDLIDDEIVYKFFEGYWDVRQVNGKWLLWNPRIREVKEPGEYWFLDKDFLEAMEEFEKTHDVIGKYVPEMYALSQEPGNENLSMEELYNKAKEMIDKPDNARAAKFAVRKDL